jgi:hypothetical protein
MAPPTLVLLLYHEQLLSLGGNLAPPPFVLALYYEQLSPTFCFPFSNFPVLAESKCVFDLLRDRKYQVIDWRDTIR